MHGETAFRTRRGQRRQTVNRSSRITRPSGMTATGTVIGTDIARTFIITECLSLSTVSGGGFIHGITILTTATRTTITTVTRQTITTVTHTITPTLPTYPTIMTSQVMVVHSD